MLMKKVKNSVWGPLAPPSLPSSPLTSLATIFPMLLRFPRTGPLLTLLLGTLSLVLGGLTPPPAFCDSVTSSDALCPPTSGSPGTAGTACHHLTALPMVFTASACVVGRVARSLPVSLSWNVSSLEAEHLAAQCCVQGTRRVRWMSAECSDLANRPAGLGSHTLVHSERLLLLLPAMESSSGKSSLTFL